MAEYKLNAQVREVSGKNRVDKLRAEGLIPAVIYQKGAETVSYTHLTLPTTPYV